MNKYLIAAVQMNSQPDLESNFKQASSLISEAAGHGARLVGLPENFAFLGNLNERLEQAEIISEKAQIFLKQIAADHEIYLLGGSFPVPAGEGKVYNRSLLIDPGGEIVASYDKIHLFDVDLDKGESYRESDYVKAGNISPVIFESEEIGIIGLTICYDLRFPELYRTLSNKGAELLTVPSAFTKTTGRKHWKPLLKARAIENTSYIFAPAQTGIHGKKRETHGHSMIIDPWGEVLAEADGRVQVILAEIDPEILKEVRESIPSLRHRRIF